MNALGNRIHAKMITENIGYVLDLNEYSVTWYRHFNDKAEVIAKDTLSPESTMFALNVAIETRIKLITNS